MSTAKIRTVVTALFVFVLAMWFVLPATATATSGEMHVTQNTVLTEDHSGEIVIDADNVTLDCAGHLVTGTGIWFVILVDGHSGVTVKNCRITAGENGLVVLNSTGPNTLLHNSGFSNRSQGFALGYADGTVAHRQRGERQRRSRVRRRGFDGPHPARQLSEPATGARASPSSGRTAA